MITSGQTRTEEHCRRDPRRASRAPRGSPSVRDGIGTPRSFSSSCSFSTSSTPIQRQAPPRPLISSAQVNSPAWTIDAGEVICPPRRVTEAQNVHIESQARLHVFHSIGGCICCSRARVRRFRRSGVRQLLCRNHGTTRIAAGHRSPTAVDRLFRGHWLERGIAWRAADLFALRDFLGVGLENAPPNHSTISRTRRLIDLETHRAIFTLGVAVPDPTRADLARIYRKRKKRLERRLDANQCAFVQRAEGLSTSQRRVRSD